MGHQKQSQHFFLRDKPLSWNVDFPNWLRISKFPAHPGPLMGSHSPSWQGSFHGQALVGDTAAGWWKRKEAGQDMIPRREMLPGRSRATGRTDLPGQIPAALPGCGAGQDPVSWLMSPELIAAWGWVGTGRLAGLRDNENQSLHPICWLRLAEMLSLQVRFLSSTAWPRSLPWSTRPCRRALPAVVEPYPGMFVWSCRVRLSCCRGHLEKPHPDLSPPLVTSRVM